MTFLLLFINFLYHIFRTLELWTGIFDILIYICQYGGLKPWINFIRNIHITIERDGHLHFLNTYGNQI